MLAIHEATTVTIPAYATLSVEDPEPLETLIGVMWEGRALKVFARDLSERGTRME